MKKLIVIAMILLLSFSVFANPEPEVAATETAAVEEENKVSYLPTGDKPTEKMKIIIWTSLAGNARQSVIDCATEFNSIQSDYEVEVQYTSNIYTKMLTSTEAERPDIVHATGNECSRYNNSVGTEEQLIIPIQQYIDYDGVDMSVIIKNLSTNVVFNGEWYGLPVGNTSVGFYYNLDILNAHGIDFTTLDSYEDIYHAAQKLKAEGVDMPVSLRVDSADFLNFGLIAEGLNWFNNDNGRTGTPTAHLFDTDPEIKESVMRYFTTVAAMRDEGLLNYVPTAADQRNMFSQNEIPILLGYASTYEAIWKLCQGTGVNFAYSVYPTFRAEEKQVAQGAGGAIFYVTNTGNTWKEYGAWLFLKYMMSDKWACDFAIQSGYIPITKSAAATERYVEYMKTTNPWAQDIIDAQDASITTTSIPQLPYQKDYNEVYSYVIKKLIQDTTYTPEQAFEELCTGTTDAIEMYHLEIGIVL